VGGVIGRRSRVYNFARTDTSKDPILDQNREVNKKHAENCFITYEYEE